MTLRLRLLLLLAVGLPLLLAGNCFSASPPAGSFSKASATSDEVIKAAQFALQAQSRNEGAKANLQLVKVISAESQVVAGTNYRLKLKVNFNGKEKSADALVWWQAWRKPEPYQLTSWKWH